jgi:hypothetical protein
MPSAARAVSLVAVTDEARAALGDRNEVPLNSFPFKVGRESRLGRLETLQQAIDRRIRGVPQLNDLYLVEPPSRLLHIARAHFAIDEVDGGYELIDRDSHCGVGVGPTRVGSDAPVNSVELKDGDVIVVGTRHSPYVFKFQIRAHTP